MTLVRVKCGEILIDFVIIRYITRHYKDYRKFGKSGVKSVHKPNVHITDHDLLLLLLWTNISIVLGKAMISN